jgi:hypothetical protein
VFLNTAVGGGIAAAAEFQPNIYMCGAISEGLNNKSSERTGLIIEE